MAMRGGECEPSEVSSLRSRWHRYCRCRVEARLRTLWTEKNPGRRFYGYYKGKNGCNYFSWHDGEIGKREQKVIAGLVQKLDLVEDRLKLCSTALVISVVVIFLLVLVLLKAMA